MLGQWISALFGGKAIAAAETKTKQLEHKVFHLERDIELYLKIKQVADYQKNFIFEQMDANTTLQNIWVSSNDTIDHIRSAIANSAQELKGQKDTLAESSAGFDQVHMLLSSVIENLNTIGNQTQDAREAVNGLNEVGGRIENLVTAIQNIADQTNLLALNAAIEAARAGESGRGFAVVADEVRTLAKRTGDSSAEITSLVSTITSETRNVSDKIEASEKSTQELSNTTSQVRGVISHITTTSHEMSKVISHASIQSFIQTVKMDHVIWKSEVYKVLWGLSDKNIRDLPDHTCCRLGKWYYEGDGHNLYRQLSSFQALESHHKDVHSNGILALKHHEANRGKEKIQSLQAMEDASNRVLDKLTELEAAVITLEEEKAAAEATATPNTTELF